MQSSVILYGLKVENISPNNLTLNNNLDQTIEITFNSDLNASTIIGNILVIKDSDLKFANIESLNNYSFEIVEGVVSYKNKVITFKPTSLLMNNTRYVIVIKNNVKDILGKAMMQDFVSSFYTNNEELIKPTIITSPKNNSTFSKMPEFTWTKSEKENNMYIFQISKFNTFESLVFEKEVFINILKPEITLSNDVYYVRVKAIDTDFSDTFQIYINSTENYPVNASDEVFNGNDFFEFENNTVEVLEIFPTKDDVNIDTKLKNIYIKVSGIINYEDLNIYDNFIKGVVYDADDLDVNKDHGEVDYSLSIVNDTDENTSYIIIGLT